MFKFFKGRGPRPPTRSTAHRLFHGVAIRTTSSFTCDAVTNLMGKRFLSEESPRLPLDQCTNPKECGCIYQHFDDRRADLRRESDQGLPVKGYSEDHRQGVGRRVTDG